MIFIICQRILTPLIAGMAKSNPYPICSFDLGYLLVCLGAVHLLCQTILASSGPPPPSVKMRHNLAYPHLPPTCMTQ